MSTSTKIGQHFEDTEQLQVMKQMLDDKQITAIPKEGDFVQGTVINLAKNLVRLDIEGLGTGVVRGPELYDESGEYSNIKIGDQVEATVLDIENELGELELSFSHAGHQKAWDHLEELKQKSEIVSAKIISANKGGLMIRVGHIVGFLPVSQLTTEHYPRVEGGDKNKILEKLNQLVNKTLDVKIIDVNETDDKLIVSEKAAWEDQQKNVLEKYKPGTIVEGIVTGVVDFGAFVEFDDGLEGLVHISELAWQRIDNPHDTIKVGEKVKAEIIGVDGSKISLSIKKLQKDPWKEATGRYKIGQTVHGKVLKVNPFGLFVELDDEIHGLAHVSELSTAPNTDPTKIAQPGDEKEFVIISIEPEQHRLGLRLKTDETDAGESKHEEKTETDVTNSPEEKTDPEVKPESQENAKPEDGKNEQDGENKTK